MFKRYAVTFLLVVVSAVVLIGCATVLPESEEVKKEAAAQPVNIPQNSDSTLLVPESTMGEAAESYDQNWDDNPVATIPESTMSGQPQQYLHNWDDNPVSTIPESTMGK